MQSRFLSCFRGSRAAENPPIVTVDLKSRAAIRLVFYSPFRVPDRPAPVLEKDQTR